MTDQFFGHLPDGERELYRAVTAVMAEHFNSKGERAAFLAEAAIEHGILNGYFYEIMDRPKDTAALERIDRALLEIGRALSDASITIGARHTLMKHLTFGPYLKKLPLEAVSEEGTECSEYMENTGNPNARAIYTIENQLIQIRTAVSAAKNEIQASERSKRSPERVNARAISMVSAARFVWRLAKEQDAPAKALNEASPFKKFLADLLKACGIDGSPRSAFSAWHRENSGSQ